MVTEGTVLVATFLWKGMGTFRGGGMDTLSGTLLGGATFSAELASVGVFSGTGRNEEGVATVEGEDVGSDGTCPGVPA